MYRNETKHLGSWDLFDGLLYLKVSLNSSKNSYVTVSFLLEKNIPRFPSASCLQSVKDSKTVMVKIKRDKNNLRRTCQRMAVYLFMQVSNTNGIHLCTGGQNKSKKFFKPISCLLPGVSVSPDLLCCVIFTLSEVKNASRKLFPLPLSRH